MTPPDPSDRIDLPEPFRRLDDLGATLLHHVVFDTVAFQTVPFDILAHNAMMRRPETIPLSTWELIVRDCLTNGWLRCLDEAALAEIASSLTGVELVCSEEETPRREDIDFTIAGVQAYTSGLSRTSKLECRLNAPAIRLVPHPGFDSTHIECYSVLPLSVPEALSGTREGWVFELIHRPLLLSTNPEPTGPWCSRWWNQHPRGYRMTAGFGT
jgi:hypothetical protein